MVERLKITPLVYKGDKLEKRLPDITVMFNPESYSISKSVSWSPPPSSGGGSSTTDRKVNAPTLTFGGGGSRQLTLELFFDVTQSDKPIETKPDVRQETNQIVDLTRMIRGEQGSAEPPRVCEVSWGQAPTNSDFPFQGVITSLTQKFTLFAPDGRPLRANLNLTFLEFLPPEEDQRKTDPELTSHIVRRGDTLSRIADKVYSDPTKWRSIATANRLSDPRQLDALIGQRLTIPKLLS
jgi:Contractile injection system tube protein/LysM domain